MGRLYSTKDLFRHTPNALLARYFANRGVFAELDFGAMDEARPDALFQAWLALPEAQRKAMDAECREIFELSCEKGFSAIRDEAQFHLAHDPAALAGLIERLAGCGNHFERAMVTFLDYPDYWKGASLFYHADSLKHWRKRKNLPHVSASVDDASLQELAAGIRDYFHQTEGRGNNCVVEPFRRGELDYFFAYPEDFSQHAIEWVEGKFGRRPHNPAFEVIFVFSQADGSLDLNLRAAPKAVQPLQSLFAKAILKLPELPPDRRDERVYDLSLLIRGEFRFVFERNSGIQAVTIKKLRLSSKLRMGDRITLEADTTRNPHALSELLAELRKSISLQHFNVTQVELAASITTDALTPPKSVTIRITHPNSCSLKYDDVGLALREMLHASGIEPKTPAEFSTTVDARVPA